MKLAGYLQQMAEKVRRMGDNESADFMERRLADPDVMAAVEAADQHAQSSIRSRLLSEDRITAGITCRSAGHSFMTHNMGRALSPENAQSFLGDLQRAYEAIFGDEVDRFRVGPASACLLTFRCRGKAQDFFNSLDRAIDAECRKSWGGRA